MAKAKEFFSFAAQRYSDEYAARAAYEVGVMEYNARNKPRAQYWLNFYLQHYPHGVYGVPAQRLVESLRANHWFDAVEGTKKPDMEDALFKYNKMSLGALPHYWFVQGGLQYQDLTFQQPMPQQKFGSTDELDIAALANVGVGIGPVKQDDVTVFAGYTYRQLWHTDTDRISEWLEGPTAIQYFPFRADLLERRHQLYADLRREFAGRFYVGLFARYEYDRIGSTYFPSPEVANLRLTINLSEQQLLIPWVGMTYNNMRTLFYLYMHKQLAYDTPDFSNKSYDFGTSGGSPTMSFGISHTMDFPLYDLSLDVELFQYEFIYNDFWLDYKRQGLFVAAEEEFIPKWVANAILGYYKDTYVLPRVKSNSCSTVQTSESATNTAGGPPVPPVVCDRDDTGLLFQLGLYWNLSQFQRLGFYLQYVQNQNPSQKEFNSTTETVQFMYTMAFPSVKRVARFIDRFADTAFTKEAQWVPIDSHSQKVLNDTFRLRQPVFISGDALPVTFQTFIVAVHGDFLLLANKIKPRYIREFTAAKAYSLQAGMVRFQSDRVASDGESIVFPLKADSVIEETRQSERFSFTADERVIAEILNPFDGETRLSKSVMDMSATGVSLRTLVQSRLFLPDTYLPSVRIMISGELYKKGPGRVVYSRKLMDLGGQMRTQVGIKFES